MTKTTTLLQHSDKGGYGTLQDAAVEHEDGRPPPLSKASLFSRLFFTFTYPVIAEGNTKQLNKEDLWHLEDNLQTLNAAASFKTNFERSNGSVLRAALRTHAGTLVACGLISLFTMASDVFAPVVLHHVIDAFTAVNVDTEDLWMWLGVFFATRVVSTVLTGQRVAWTALMGMRLTAAIKTLVFEKAMRRSVQSKSDSKAVEIANLFTSDVQSVQWAADQFSGVWALPLQIVIILYMLYDVLGVASFAGVVVIGLSLVASTYITKISGQAFGSIMENQDTRMKLIKEVFGAIQVVKLNAWEAKFVDKILKVREQELSAIRYRTYLNTFNSLVLWGTPVLVSIASFSVYTLVLGKPLTAATVFTAMALFNAIRGPLTNVPRTMSQCIQAKVSLDRMADFLTVDEYDSTNVSRDNNAYPANVMVEIKDGSFGWSKDTPLLRNVNLQVKKGDLVVVHGAVGSGKSSLCSALLGEMDKLSGSVFVRGRVAYYSQQTWIQNMTIRENILFGKAYDEKKYQQVLEACGLLPDLAQFPAGDSTEIGQKGVNLSGGQKARLCLARACYSDADVFILDSPLAAVDAVVQSEIFSKCLCGLLESKTIVLVTHAPDIIASEAANYTLGVVDGELIGDRKDAVQRRSAYAARVSPRKAKKSDLIDGETVKTDAEKKEEGRLVDEESREEGRVSKEVFFRYFNALGGISACVLVVFILLLWQAFQISSDLWLSHWTGQKLGAYDESETEYNMTVYALLGLGTVIFVLARSITIALLGIYASRHMFEGMTRALLKAPMRFFDANPIGRIVNRYGDDMSAIDFMIPMGLGAVVYLSFFIVCQLGTAIYTLKILGVLVLPLAYLYFRLTSVYLAPSREISRLIQVSDSPVLSHVSSSEEGLTVIRAFGPTYIERAVAEAASLIDNSNRTWFAEGMVGEWFEMHIQLIGCALVIVIVSALVSLHEYLSPGLVGLVFTYTLNIQQGLVQLVAIWAWLEIQMVSPERILEYASIPPEGNSKPLVIEPSAQWPQQGSIRFDNVVFSYKPGATPVLKGLSFDIKNNEKIGIVGRTGAGKSSLTMALFRVNELESGRIMIDGTDISTMPLQSLRSRLSIIPQAPVLFKGPLRSYMDPFDEYTDAEIWEAFEKVEMKDQIGALEGQLSYELSENGENFSVGERQMLCMARAMLTKSRIVVMDEATASIDHATEKKLQHMINRDFKEATVLTIAHRLATVLDSDRIMVLSDGKVVEFDTPHNLVENEGGVFYELAKEGGYLEQFQAK
ncbi:hypothetical protein Poli38472_012137 [Pythium oligandrum]|uniref:Multidrug resistance-associated protein 1 n=1 Tax=Pythium oligandrum TaxID=41045 RepID=A0A8K1FLD7_PYTOL|nr:hypothetical protein Poli38472_012137 [Pythium oligandrum]|eukprot:TMW67021.1 hypothetical protein Poli38472_012137 [Pythium oligandrum]